MTVWMSTKLAEMIESSCAFKTNLTTCCVYETSAFVKFQKNEYFRNKRHDFCTPELVLATFANSQPRQIKDNTIGKERETQ